MKSTRRIYWFVLLLLIVLLGTSAGCFIIPIESPQASAPVASTPPPVPPPQPLPVINFFTASPQLITEGQAVVLNWNVSGASAVTIQPTFDAVGAIGSIQISPTKDIAYTLVASNEAGSVTSYVTITVKVINDSASQRIVGTDPVTGRNEDIAFEWEQLCLSTEYQVQIAKDPGFTLMVFDSGVYAPSSTTSPAMLYLAGGRLEAGHTYYWRARVRAAATGQIVLGPWSYPQRFIVGAGYPVTAPYYPGIQLFSPVNSCCRYPVAAVPFTWSPYKETTRYRFVLARDPALTDVVCSADTFTTAYLYEGALDYSTSYFWQVRAIAPAPSDPSPVFTFSTEAKPLPPPVLETEVPESSPMPFWVWVVVGVGIALIIVVIVLLFIVRR